MTIPEPKRRWFHLSPDRLVVGLLVMIGLLWLSDRFQWFGFNHHKGWTVLIAVAAVGVAAVVMLLWWTAGLIFGWRFQFGIRSVLAFCLACSVVVSWFAVEWKDARRQADMVEWMKGSGVSANYDWECDADTNLISNRELPGPRWLRNLVGVDFFSAVVVIYGTKITDAELEQLKGLTQLRELVLNQTKITDAGLTHLKGLTQLQKLYLINTGVTDAGLKQLEDLTELQQLWLGSTLVTDAGVERLQHSLPNCKINY